MTDFHFEIVKKFGIVSEEKSGWKKELNLIAWNGREPKFDLRDWSPDHEKMGKGITFSREDAIKIVEVLGKAITETS